MHQIAAVKKKAIGGLLNISKILNFIDRQSKLKTCSWFKSDTNRFLYCLAIWTTKYPFALSSNYSECCSNNTDQQRNTFFQNALGFFI